MDEMGFPRRAAPWLIFGSAVAVMFSIAVSQILLGGALAAMLVGGCRPRLPRIWPLLAFFLLGTLLALAFADDLAVGLPQVKKMFVFAELLAVFSCLRNLKMARNLVLCWSVSGAITAIIGIVQYVYIYRHPPQGVDAGSYYDLVRHRITGTMSHWMTFSGEGMIALLMLAAFLFFAPLPRRRNIVLWIACAGLMIAGLLLGMTRSVWLGVFMGGLYLIWFWKRWLVLIVPVLAGLLLLASPATIRERAVSIFQPRKDTDSNEFRYVVRRAGAAMIKAHPWLGIGPDGPKKQLLNWIPPDVPRPLPSGFYQHLHNVYYQYAADRGIPTMLVLVAMLIAILCHFARGLRNLPPGRGDRRFLLHGGIAVLIGIVFEGWYEVNLGDTEVLTMFLVVVGIGYLALEPAKKEIEQLEHFER